MSKEGEEQFLATTIAEIDLALTSSGFKAKSDFDYPIPKVYATTIYNKTDMSESWQMELNLSIPSKKSEVELWAK